MVWEERMVTNIKDKNPLDLKSHQILHLWFSSSFPIGSYAYSHGLESIIDDKLIKNKNDVLEFIKSILFEGTCRNEYIFIKATYDGIDINDLVLELEHKAPFASPNMLVLQKAGRALGEEKLFRTIIKNFHIRRNYIRAKEFCIEF